MKDKKYVWPPTETYDWRNPWSRMTRKNAEQVCSQLEELYTTKNNPLFFQMYRCLSWVKPRFPDLFERAEVCRQKIFSFSNPERGGNDGEHDTDLNFVKQLATDILDWERGNEEYKVHYLLFCLERVFKLLPPEVLKDDPQLEEQNQNTVPEKE